MSSEPRPKTLAELSQIADKLNETMVAEKLTTYEAEIVLSVLHSHITRSTAKDICEYFLKGYSPGLLKERGIV